MAIPENTPGSPELSVVRADVEAPSSPPVPFLYLEICRGKTSYPERPVFSPNFLIGCGAGCDLRLGGGEIPEAHSVLLASDEEVRVQWLAEAPPLLLNGEPVTDAALSEGDQIGIGRFAFIVHRILEHQTSQPQPTTPETAEPERDTTSLRNLLAEANAAETAEDLSEVPATELLAKFEAEQSSVEEFEDAIRQGEEALLFAAAQRAADLAEGNSQEIEHEATEPEAAEVASGEPAEAEILDELERVIQQLSGFSSELDERAARLASQEATQAEAAELLLDAQKELAAQLQRFQQQIVETHDKTPTQEPAHPKLRKAA